MNTIEVYKPELLKPIAQPPDLIQAHKEAVSIIQKVLENGRDYGIIPGTGDKPTLLKPGAERLCIAFGVYPTYEIVEKEIDHDRENTYKGNQKSFGFYRYVVRCTLIHRSDGRTVADGLASCSTMESKYISRPRDCENTVVKMACKRALVSAVLNAFGLSDRFTCDIEDSPTQAYNELQIKEAGQYLTKTLEFTRSEFDGYKVDQGNVWVQAALNAKKQGVTDKAVLLSNADAEWAQEVAKV